MESKQLGAIISVAVCALYVYYSIWVLVTVSSALTCLHG